uniref:Kelch repeat containing protein n=1 Tax=Rhipicephalus appendiculatus TaxID=34631 RepID=A0A131Z5J6_RHIAP
MTTMATSSSPADGDLVEMILEDEVVSFSRTVLMQSSPFFQDTFKDVEGKKKRVVVSGVRGQTFKDLLEYMKSGKLELSCNNVADIFHAACKLQMPDIIRRCIQMETQSSAIGRQIILYKTAERMNNVHEKNSAFYHLVSNFALVAQSDEFLQLDAGDVCELLSSDVIGCKGELDVFNAACRWLNHKVDERMDQAARLMYCVRFPLMSLMELSHCVEAKIPPGLQDVHNVRVMILSAVCFWVARTAGKEAEVGHLARTPRHYVTEVPGVPGSKELQSSDDAGEAELPSLISVTLGAAKARLLPTSNLSSRACAREPWVAHLQESRQFLSPDHETEQVRSLSALSSTAESDSPVDSLAPTVCESSFNDTSSFDAQASRPTTQESNGETMVHDSQSFFSQSDSCYRSEDKEKLYSEYVDTDSLTMHSDGDRVHKNELESLKTRYLLASQTAIQHEGLIRQSSPLSEHPEMDFFVVSPNSPQCSTEPLASISVQTDHILSETPGKDAEPGTLFLIGGVEANESPSECPILSYSIKGNAWNQAKTLPVHRYGHKAVFLDGYIYIIGGFENFSPMNLEKAASRSCFWFEVSSGRWGIMAPLNNPRAYHGLAVLDDNIYVVGGVDSANRLLSCLERYDKETDEWTKLGAELYSPRMAMGFCSHRRQLWVAGGIVQIGRRTCSTAYVEVYDPKTEKWSFAVNFLPSPRSCLTLVECGDDLYAVGGLLSHRSGRRRIFTTVEDTLVFVDERNTWINRAPMPNARHSTVAVAHDGMILIIGGRQAERPDFHFDNILAYDTKVNKWFLLANLPRSVVDYHCVLAPPEESSESLRDLLTSRGDHRSTNKVAEKFRVAAPEVKSYSQGDIAIARQYK